jgi:pantoate--beta-alanine ligase
MQCLNLPDDVRQVTLTWRCQGYTVGFVPTMGYWHEGHLSLIRAARARCAKVVASIFINPTQFAPTEDLARYPQDLERDLALAQEAGVDVVFCPDAAAMYEPGHGTWVEVPELSQGLCGASRPGHFRGVATVVTKLFWIVLPHVAFFGEKDWQQLAIIRAMTRQLSCPVEICGCPTVRESDGLAMSSRNVYLTPQERAQAPALYAMLCHLRDLVAAGERRVDVLRTSGQQFLAQHLPLARLDYLEIVHPETLAPQREATSPALAAVALFLGKARLIDNLRIA